MRSGVKPDGQPFPDTMPRQAAAQMTDNDLAALYTYPHSRLLRSPVLHIGLLTS